MEAPGIFIVQIPVKPGPARDKKGDHEIQLQRGDRYDREEWAFSDEIDTTLRYSRFVVPMTLESYRNLIATRPPGTVGRGFESDWLLEQGFITEAEHRQAAIARVGEGEVYKDCLIVPVKHGRFTFFDARDMDGHPLRARSFAKPEKAREFIDGLKEAKDGLDVQPDARQPA